MSGDRDLALVTSSKVLGSSLSLDYMSCLGKINLSTFPSDFITLFLPRFDLELDVKEEAS